jgi:hypothetical protein
VDCYGCNKLKINVTFMLSALKSKRCFDLLEAKINAPKVLKIVSYNFSKNKYHVELKKPKKEKKKNERNHI